MRIRVLALFGHLVAVQLLAIVLTATPLSAQANQTAKDDPVSRIVLSDGNFLTGRLISPPSNDIPAGEFLPWQHDDFADPFLFDINRVESLRLINRETQSFAEGAYVVRSVFGDVLIGELIGLDSQKLTLRTAKLGDVILQRAIVQQIFRRDQSQASRVYGSTHWQNWKVFGQEPDPELAWTHPVLDVKGASIVRDCQLDDQTQIRLKLSWKNATRFSLAVGVDLARLEQSSRSAFRIEVWGSDLVLCRETSRHADVVSLGKMSNYPRGIELFIRLEQNDGRIYVADRDGIELGHLKLPSDRFPDVRPGIQLTHLGGRIELESLDVIRANYFDATIDGENACRFVLNTNKNAPGPDPKTEVIVADWLDIGTESWLIREADSPPRQIDPRDVVSVQWKTKTATRSDPIQPVFRMMTTHGMVLVGTIESISHDSVLIRGEENSPPIAVPMDLVRSLQRQRNQDVADVDSEADANDWWMQSSGSLMQGTISLAASDTAAETIRFRPKALHALANSPRTTNRLQARLTKSRPEPISQLEQDRRKTEQANIQADRVRVQNQIGGRVARLNRALTFDPSRYVIDRVEHKDSGLELVSGERVIADITGIDDEFVFIQSPFVLKQQVSRSVVRSVFFQGGGTLPNVNDRQERRLMTVPRKYQEVPPTHLVVGRSGDVVRGRLVSMNRSVLLLKTKMQTIPIQRELVSEVRWLTPPKNASAGESSVDSAREDEPTQRTCRLNVKLKDDVELVLVAQRMTDDAIEGEHALLGKATVRLADVEYLVLGDPPTGDQNVHEANRWQLKLAPEPIDGQQESSDTIQSVLVGQIAPELILTTLSGDQFNLSKQRGRVIVLDFWASWCGPCMKAMPQIESTVEPFGQERVRLVAVNLQETPDTIQAVLKRLDIHPIVALDTDGLVSARYQIDAIPQTIVIDREGIVRHVIVGAGKDLQTQLQAAIKALL